MISSDPRDRPDVTHVVHELDKRLEVDYKEELGRGFQGPVYAGTFGATRVAVKQIPISDLHGQDDLVDIEHDNIVALLHVEDRSKLR